MSNKEIEAWKAQVAKGKNIFVAGKVKTIHPVVDKILRRLFEIDLIQYVKVSQNDIQASSEIAIKGRMKIPISTLDHPTAIGVHLILDIDYNTIQFYEMNFAVKGYGEKMVRAILKSIPNDWEAAIVMDWSGGFWEKMAKKYDKIVIL